MCRGHTTVIMWEAVLAFYVERVNVSYGCQKKLNSLETCGSVNGLRMGFCRCKQSRKWGTKFSLGLYF